MLKSKYLLLLTAVLVLAAAGGCIFSPDDDPPCEGPGCGGGQDPLPFPDSPDKVMTNFRTIYERMDFDEYRKLLHPDFLTILQPTTVSQFPDVGPTLDINEELHIHERMFSKQDVVDPEGHPVPGIQNIAFQTFERQQDTWTLSSATDPIPNAEYAAYDVVIQFERGQANPRLEVRGTIKFYVAHRDSLVNGVHKQYYQMFGQQDLTQTGP